MSFPSATRTARPPQRGRRGALMPTLVIMGAILLVLGLAANVWTEVLWFDQLGFAKVIWTQWGAKAALFAVGFVIMAVVVGLNLNLAFRNRPVYAPSTPEQATLDQYRYAQPRWN